MKYIEINNWEKFQHYKDRRPTWIKLLIDIIDEFDEDGNKKKFYPLSDSAKLTFVMLCCLRANYNVHIPYKDDTWLKERLGINNLNLYDLEKANYINIVAEQYQSDTEKIQSSTVSLPPEREREKEKEKEVQEGFALTSFFDKFWKAYPKKKSKGQAEKAWKKIKPKPDEQLLATMIATIERAKKSEEWKKDGGQYIPYPATWLNAKGWEDEINLPRSEKQQETAPLACEECGEKGKILQKHEDGKWKCRECYTGMSNDEVTQKIGELVGRSLPG